MSDLHEQVEGSTKTVLFTSDTAQTMAAVQ